MTKYYNNKKTNKEINKLRHIMRNLVSIFFLISIVIHYTGCSPKYTIIHERPEKPISLPADDAAHYWSQMEWWYYTGHLEAEDGKKYGFEVTFFKRLMNEDPAPGCLFLFPAHVFKDVGMIGHFAVTDFSREKFTVEEKSNIFNSWKADPKRYHTELGGWSAREKDGSHIVKADMDGYQVNLAITPKKPAALNGRKGIVEKGPGSANYYYSYTNMAVKGTITIDGKKKAVKGKSWMDHEYGTMRLVKNQKGWDWFSIQFDDNTELMIYLIKNKKNVVTSSGGTFVNADGSARWLKLSDISIKSTAAWKSKKTGTTYPAAWEVTVKPLDLKLKIKPMMAEQELDLYPVTYWEGAVEAVGTSRGAAVRGQGYIELVGYAKNASFGGIDFP
ncbi:MAG: hypothetical protein GY754_42800 [bacterium]|nr:hypothetical protein [bacterium]